MVIDIPIGRFEKLKYYDIVNVINFYITKIYIFKLVSKP